MEEVWKSLSGVVTNGDGYSVSNYGRVRSNSRIIVDKNGKKRLVNPKILKSAPMGKKNKQYLGVVLCNNGTSRIYKVHRLVALAFIPLVEGKDIVNHKDGNKLNNHVSNLEWCTQQENVTHAIETGLFNPKQLRTTEEEQTMNKMSSRGKQLLVTRQILGLKQSEFAELLHIPRTTLTAYENDGRRVPIHVMNRYENVVDSRLREFVLHVLMAVDALAIEYELEEVLNNGEKEA